MSTDRKTWWQEFGAVIAGVAAVATVHAIVVVPGILTAAEVRAREIASTEASEQSELVRAELRQRVVTAEAQHASFVTRAELEQFAQRFDQIEAQLDRIETRLAR